jgi:hypothetical protein
MMYIELKAGEAYRIGIGESSFRRFWRAVGQMTAGLVLIILAVAALSPGDVAAAAPVEDVPCTVCAEASDPVQYTSLAAGAAAERKASVIASAARYSGLAAMYAADLETGVASASGLTIGAASDPVQYTSLVAGAAAEREASVAASAARYSGLAAWYDRTLDAAFSAYSARMEGLADCYATGSVLCSIR